VLEVCLRRESKNRWERRTPLVPVDVASLIGQGIPLQVESSPIRIFGDEEYKASGAALVPDSSGCALVIGIKEPTLPELRPGQAHLAFSHTIKGQRYNMAMLRHILANGITLLDYEPICQPNGKRLIAFGRFAGLAGAIDTLHLAARKWEQKHGPCPLSSIKQTHQYASLKHAREAFQNLAPMKTPLWRIVLAGTGNVGKGAAEVLDWLALPRLNPEDFLRSAQGPAYTVLDTADLHARIGGGNFDRAEYDTRGRSAYTSSFDRFLGHCDILLQTPYWTDKYPRHLDRARMIAHRDQLPWMIGDLSCDIDGSLACTKKPSTIDEPAFTYLPQEDQIVAGISWQGPTVMAIDNLPCELPRDASAHFSSILVDLVPKLAAMRLDQPFEACGLGPTLAAAVITWRGQLTPRYAYLNAHLNT